MGCHTIVLSIRGSHAVDSIALNYKGIPYRTQWVEHPDIAATLKAIGMKPNPPTALAPYTLPAIYDPRTRTAIQDSLKIVAYLDEAYPETPQLYDPSTRVLQAAFQDALFQAAQQPVNPLAVPICIGYLLPASQEYFRPKMEAFMGRKLADFCPPEKRPEQWVAVEKGFGVLASWFESAGDDRLLLTGGGANGKHGRVSHADTSLAAFLIFLRLCLGKDSQEWRRVESWNGGRWKRFMDYFEKWLDASH